MRRGKTRPRPFDRPRKSAPSDMRRIRGENLRPDLPFPLRFPVPAYIHPPGKSNTHNEMIGTITVGRMVSSSIGGPGSKPDLS